ncbi:MAG: HIT domain-containing protein [Phycisphaerales bacterium]
MSGSQQPPQPHDSPVDPTPAMLHAPWRLAYLESLEEKERTSGPPKPSSGSFLRDYWLDPGSDATHHVVVRTATGMILLNAYPYASGHLLVALGEPAPRLLEYSPSQRADFWGLMDMACDLMERTLNPQGINMGINQGRAAGAGVPQHLHGHLVPRWGGDTNFITVIGQVRIVPGALESMWERYRQTALKLGLGA